MRAKLRTYWPYLVAMVLFYHVFSLLLQLLSVIFWGPPAYIGTVLFLVPVFRAISAFVILLIDVVRRKEFPWFLLVCSIIILALVPVLQPYATRALGSEFFVGFYRLSGYAAIASMLAALIGIPVQISHGKKQPQAE